MSGLRKAAIMAYQRLKNCLQPYGYVPVQGTTGMWKHGKRTTKIFLYVDEFGVIHWSKKNLNTFAILQGNKLGTSLINKELTTVY